MKLTASLVFGLLIFFVPYTSLKLLPEQLSQDVQPVLSGFFAVLSLSFYLKKGKFRSSIPASVIFPAVFLVGVVLIYLLASVVADSSTPTSLVVERTLAFIVGPIFYLSGAGIAYICSKRPSEILNYFISMLYIIIFYGFIQLLGIILKAILGFELISDIDIQFRSLIMVRAEPAPRLMLFVPEPSFLPSFLIFLVLTASTIIYFDHKNKVIDSGSFKDKNFLAKNKRLLILITALAVIFSFSILVYMTAVIFVSLFFMLKIIYNLSSSKGKKKLFVFVQIYLLSLLIVPLALLLFTTDYLALLVKFVPALTPYPVVQRLDNLQNDPSTLIRRVKLEALVTCSIQNFPFGAGLGGYYNQSVKLITTAPSLIGVDFSTIKQLRIESQQKTGTLFSVVFGTTCECGVFGFSGLLLMFFPSLLSFITVIFAPKTNQVSPLWPLITASSITTIVIFTAAIPFALPFPWIVLGMCNYLLSRRVLIPKEMLHAKVLLSRYQNQ